MRKRFGSVASIVLVGVLVASGALAQGRYAWVPAGGGNGPAGAVQGGGEGDHAIFICRAPWQGGVHVGKVVGTTCNFGWGGQEITVPSYEVLVGALWRWVPASGGSVPPLAVVGGHEANGSPQYVCRAYYNGGMHPGKVVGANCNIGWGGAEVTLPTYEVLTSSP